MTSNQLTFIDKVNISEIQSICVNSAVNSAMSEKKNKDNRTAGIHKPNTPSTHRED